MWQIVSPTQVSFKIQVSDVSKVEWRFPFEDVQGVALNVGPSGQVCFPSYPCLTSTQKTPVQTKLHQNLPEDKCIFVRGYRATRILGIIPRLQGAAEPTHSPNEDEPEPDIHLISIPSDIKVILCTSHFLNSNLTFLQDSGSSWRTPRLYYYSG